MNIKNLIQTHHKNLMPSMHKNLTHNAHKNLTHNTEPSAIAIGLPTGNPAVGLHTGNLADTISTDTVHNTVPSVSLEQSALVSSEQSALVSSEQSALSFSDTVPSVSSDTVPSVSSISPNPLRFTLSDLVQFADDFEDYISSLPENLLNIINTPVLSSHTNYELKLRTVPQEFRERIERGKITVEEMMNYPVCFNMEYNEQYKSNFTEISFMCLSQERTTVGRTTELAYLPSSRIIDRGSFILHLIKKDDSTFNPPVSAGRFIKMIQSCRERRGYEGELKNIPIKMHNPEVITSEDIDRGLRLKGENTEYIQDLWFDFDEEEMRYKIYTIFE